MIDLEDHVTAASPGKGSCDLCEHSLERAPSVKVEFMVVIKKISKRVCIVCARKVVGIIELRISQARDGKFES